MCTAQNIHGDIMPSYLSIAWGKNAKIFSDKKFLTGCIETVFLGFISVSCFLRILVSCKAIGRLLNNSFYDKSRELFILLTCQEFFWVQFLLSLTLLEFSWTFQMMYFATPSKVCSLTNTQKWSTNKHLLINFYLV